MIHFSTPMIFESRWITTTVCLHAGEVHSSRGFQNLIAVYSGDRLAWLGSQWTHQMVEVALAITLSGWPMPVLPRKTSSTRGRYCVFCCSTLRQPLYPLALPASRNTS